MSNDVIFQKDYEGSEVTIRLYGDVVELHDTYNDHLIKFRTKDIDKYIALCYELRDYQEYDEEEDEYYDVDEIYTHDYDDGFLLSGNYAIPCRFEYYIEAIQEADIDNMYNIDTVAKLSRKELENYNVSTLEHILNKIKEQKELQQARPAC